MFDTNNKSFNYSKPTRNGSLVTYFFYNQNQKVYRCMFDIHDKAAELTFDYNDMQGYDKFTHHGHVTEKLNTCKVIVYDFLKKYGDEVDGIWWQATPSRFKTYQRYFKSQSNKVDELPYYGEVIPTKEYGYSGMFRSKKSLGKILDF